MTLTTPEQRERIQRAVSRMTPDQREKMLAAARPRIVQPYMKHVPHPKQQVFLSLRGREAMFGGAAGGGKSDTLLMAALQYVDVPGYSALLLRRTWPDLTAAGAILDRATDWLTGTPVRKRNEGRMWEFPSGAKLSFGYMQYDTDVTKFQSAEFQFIGFDELTHFTERQYTYLFSRLRRPRVACLSCSRPMKQQTRAGGLTWTHTTDEDQAKCGPGFPDPMVMNQYPPAPDGTQIFDVPLRMRGATNPGGIGHEWVRERFINPKTKVQDAIFVPSRISDNPSIDQQEYYDSLSHLLPVERERLMNGDWDVTEEGVQFQRHWFKSVRAAPATRMVVRYWDNAATAGAGDWTVGCKLRLDSEGHWFIEDIVRGQWSSEQKQNIILQTAIADGRFCRIVMEQEPGSAGKDVMDMYQRRILLGFPFTPKRSTGDKETRAVPAAIATEAGNVYMVEGQWNKAFLDEIGRFPFAAHDDQVDAFSGAFNFLADMNRSSIIV